MLNDLLAIAQGLAAHGVDIVARHPDIKDMARGGALRVRLDIRGQIAGLEVADDDGRGTFWTLRDGQHNSFPGLKTARGLFVLDAAARKAHEDAWKGNKEPIARRNQLLELLQACPFDEVQEQAWPTAGHRKRIADRLQQLRPLADDPITAAVPATFARFLASLETTPGFLKGLATALEDKVRNGGAEWQEWARMAFMGPIALLLDVPDDEFDRDAGDLRQIGPMSAALAGDPGQGSPGGGEGGICALGGRRARLHVGNFPQPNLPGLGQTYLFARNSDIPSMARYGKTGSASFPIAADLAGQLYGTLNDLTANGRAGQSWRLVPAERGDKPDLLIASLPAAPDLQLADALAGNSEDNVEDDAASGAAGFFELTSHVLDQARGISKQEAAEENVTILLLRAVDPANRKSIYHRRTSARDFFEAAQGWKAATANTPDWLTFPMPMKEKKLVARKPPRVAPLSITALSRMRFVGDGRRRVDVIGITAATAFQLFVGEGDVRATARAALRLLLQRHSPLLGGLSAARARGSGALKTFDPKADLRHEALRSATWLGVFLYRLNRLKEDYMSDAAFLLGQLLAAADTVHIGYCLDVRKGSIPPILLGNSLLGVASANPYKALDLLLRRWPPYAAWAKHSAAILEKAKRAEKNDAFIMRAAIYDAPELRRVAVELRERLVAASEVIDEKFRAELLLGYMAGFQARSKKDEEAGQE